MATLKQLAHARALARLRSFSLAAKALHLSQPALTRSILALEAGLGVPLFDRGAGGVEPTVFGELLLRQSASILAAHEELVREVQLLAGLETGALCVAAGTYPSDVLVPPVAAAMAARHPKLDCRLRQGTWQEAAAQVLAREADLGLAEVSGAARDARLQTEPIARHQLYMYVRAGHPLAGSNALSTQQVVAFPWATSRLPARVLSGLPAPIGRAGTGDVEAECFVPAWEVESIATAKRIVAASDAIGGAMLVQIERELEEGTVVLLPYAEDWMRLGYGFIHLRDRTLSPAALAFMAECRRQDAELAAREALLRDRHVPARGASRRARRRS